MVESLRARAFFNPEKASKPISKPGYSWNRRARNVHFHVYTKKEQLHPEKKVFSPFLVKLCLKKKLRSETSYMTHYIHQLTFKPIKLSQDRNIVGKQHNSKKFHLS